MTRILEKTIPCIVNMTDPDEEFAFNFDLVCEAQWSDKLGWVVSFRPFMGDQEWKHEDFSIDEWNQVVKCANEYDWDLVSRTEVSL